MINLDPIKCLAIKVWFPSVGDPWIASRADFVVTDTRQKTSPWDSNAEPPATA